MFLVLLGTEYSIKHGESDEKFQASISLQFKGKGLLYVNIHLNAGFSLKI